MMASDGSKCLRAVSFNMHGFYQGCPVIEDLIDSEAPDVLMLQEHWLTPSKLCLFDSRFTDYFPFGCSAMCSRVEAGMLRGRPYGGVMTLIKKSLGNVTTMIHCEDRFVVVKILNCLIINVYLPCSGTPDRQAIYENLLDDICFWRDRYHDCECIIGGDFNVKIDSGDVLASRIVDLVSNCRLIRCDDVFPLQKISTYINYPLNQESCIDYILVSQGCVINNFIVLDPEINFSDHLPLLVDVTIECTSPTCSGKGSSRDSRTSNTRSANQIQLRWDKADRSSYYYLTGQLLEPVRTTVDNAALSFESGNASVVDSYECIDSIYSSVVSVLQSAASTFVPKHRKGFFKFWWDEEMNILKEASMEANKAWKSAGKPRHGTIFHNRQSSRAKYRKRLREKQIYSTEVYTNDLHEALLEKKTTAFWQCWRSKFESVNKCSHVEGCADPDIVVNKFAMNFQKTISCNDPHQADALKLSYMDARDNYHGLPFTNHHKFDTELVSSIVNDLKVGKALDIDGLSAEHLQFCHPVLSVILTKLFNLLISCSYVPDGFRHSYIVPIPKMKDCYNKSLTCDDFRGIAISSIISKVFEHCIIKRYESFFITSDNQFGFKKGVGCTYAIRSVRKVVDNYVANGSTANLCTIDVSKAFDKVNHYALLSKLMKKMIPRELLFLLENWLSGCYSCVKWHSAWSEFFRLDFGVRQGSVLSPLLFALYVDDIANISKHVPGIFVFLYADDILILSPTVSKLQELLNVIECELQALDLTINSKKSYCLRIGSRCDIKCSTITNATGVMITWVSELRYLGMTLVKSRSFKVCLVYAKRSFYRAANAVFGKIGRLASEEVILQLIASKCMPMLLFGLEACTLNKSQLSSLDFTINRFFMKLFKTNNIEIVRACQESFDFEVPSVLLKKRTEKLEIKFHALNLCL